MKNSHIRTCMIMGCLLWAFTSRAQLNPLQASYYQNQYLFNPAMAGLNEGLNLNLNYRQQWASFPGAPKNQSLTADYFASEKVGIGLNIGSDQAGLIRQTRVMGTYAYHLPLNGKNEKLSFGLSLGINDPHVDNGAINGSQNDVQVVNYNQLKAYVDGDFGIAYSNEHWLVQGAAPNLKAIFFNSEDTRIDVDRTLFITSASYKLNLNNGISDLTLEPLAMFRAVKGFDHIFDAGLNFTMNDHGLNFMGIYHSNKTAAFGFGIIQKTFDLNISYNMETGSLATYSAGSFEFGLKLKWLKK